jgi:hypothetical protein
VRSERLLMEQLDYNLLFRWFVGLNMDDANGNLVVENRHGLIANAQVFEANGTAERDVALVMLERIAGTKQVTMGGDKAYDTADFVAECTNLKRTPRLSLLSYWPPS